jgi:hypothetical protein
VKLHEEGHKLRGTITGGAHLKQRFINAGFVDIEERVKKIIVGDWRASMSVHFQTRTDNGRSGYNSDSTIDRKWFLQ